MFHWLVLEELGSNMVTKEGESHRREENSPVERNIEGVGSSLNKLIT